MFNSNTENVIHWNDVLIICNVTVIQVNSNDKQPQKSV